MGLRSPPPSRGEKRRRGQKGGHGQKREKTKARGEGKASRREEVSGERKKNATVAAAHSQFINGRTEMPNFTQT